MINVGIVGCGDVAMSSYLPGFKELSDRVRLVAAFDLVEERANAAAGMFDGATAYTDLDSFLAHSGEQRMDMVFNLTPAPLHRDITARALESGHHVYSEKPIAATVDEAQALMRIAEEQGRELFCAPATLVTSRFLWMKELLASGELGDPLFINAQIAGMGPAAWRRYPGDPKVFYSKGVGPLIDTGVYLLHVITGLMGPAKRVQAMGGTVYPERKILIDRLYGETLNVETPDLFSINLDLGDNRYAHVFSSFAVAASKSPIFELYATQGALSVERRQWYNGSGTTDVYRRDESQSGANEGWENDVSPSNPVRTAGILESGVLHALDCLEHGAEPVLTGAHATHVLEIMNAAHHSIQTGEAVDITSDF